ncbi:MAG: ABC transporter substrate-binding protein/permease [Puniceicoccales bacterium]|jgi:polar amino acid transport system substrate-binding protein|nr:ABC transporter substrate-binding protein/permease [Puniceicoccales bacterium]
MKKFFLLIFLLIGSGLSADSSLLRWAADAGSGAPNVFYRDNDLENLTGFERDIIERIAAIIGYKTKFFQNDWDVLIPGLQRNLYDVVINGIVPSEERKASVLFSKPYYACPLSLIARDGATKIKSVLDCNGKIIGILQNSKSESALTKNLKSVKIVSYPDEYSAIADLENGRVDAIVFDGQIAAYYTKYLSNLKIVDEFGELKYSIALAKGNDELLAKVNRAIDAMKKDGSLDAIISKWGIGNSAYENVMGSKTSEAEISDQISKETGRSKVLHGGHLKMLPFFAKAACITLMLSVLGMGVAIVLGISFAIVREYAPRWMRLIIISIIEFLRGTPLLIQLFFIFYGLPRVGITLSPMVAGILTLGINYASYEAENFRAGMAAVPHGQMEAARALGMSQWQSLRYIILPQAFTFILPPLTNDFIALLKDSSLVSLITIVELTKAYSIAASNSFDFFGIGIIVSIIYFLLGLPFVRIARWAEYHMKLEKRAYTSRKLRKM